MKLDNQGYFNGKGCTGYYVYGVIKHGSDYQMYVLSALLILFDSVYCIEPTDQANWGASELDWTSSILQIGLNQELDLCVNLENNGTKDV